MNRYLERAVEDEIGKLAATTSDRNAQTNVAAFNLGQLCGPGGLNESEIERRLLDAVMANGYATKDGLATARRTIRSGLEAGKKEPRAIPNGAATAPPVRMGHSEPPGPELPPASPQSSGGPLPEWTPPDSDGKPYFKDIGEPEPAPIGGEIRRHGYRRDGTVVRVKIKYRTKTGEERWTNAYLVRRPSDGASGWQARKPEGFIAGPYISAVDPFDPEIAHDPVFCSEGEKDTDELAKRGLPGFTLGGTADLPAGCEDLVRDRDVIILADNDEPGRKHAEKKAALFAKTAKRVRVLHFPETPERGDVTDWLVSHGGTVEQLWERVEQAPTWAPGPEPENEAGANEDLLQPVFDPWEDYPVPPFPFDILPPVLRQFVLEDSRLLGCDPSTFAMCVLGACSAALSHEFRLKVMRHGTWWGSPRLWIMPCGDASKKKTPIFDKVLEEIAEHEARAAKKYDEAKEEYEAALEAFDKKEGKPKPKPPPKPRRYIASDITVEKLGELLSRSRRGLMVKRDEISGWIGSMEKYGGKGGGLSDRAFWLKAYDGGRFHIDRITRGEIHIENNSVSILGGIQPEKLAEVHGLTSDGLLQRFLPVMMGASKPPIDEPSSLEKDEYERMIRKLLGAEPASLIFADEALPVMGALREHLHELMKVSGPLAKGFQSFVGKLDGVSANLALILHLIPDPQENRLHPVSKETAEDVRRLVLDFILPHAYEFYRVVGSVGSNTMVSIASWILTSQTTRVTSRELMRNVWDLRKSDLKTIQENLGPLIAGGWLEPENYRPDCKAWTVKPAVAHQLERRRRAEEVRKAAVGKFFPAVSPTQADKES